MIQSPREDSAILPEATSVPQANQDGWAVTMAYLLYIIFGFILLAIVGGLFLTFLPSATVADLERRFLRRRSGSSSTTAEGDSDQGA